MQASDDDAQLAACIGDELFVRALKLHPGVSHESWLKHVRLAIERNEVNALSCLLAMELAKADAAPLVEEHACKLLRRAITTDAAECGLSLLSFLEELRQLKQSAAEAMARAAEASDPGAEDRKRKRSDLPVAERLKLEREEACIERERHCGAAPNSRTLLALAREALEGSPAAPRCGRALLLQAHRLRKQRPKVGRRLLGSDEKPLADINGDPSLPWPPTPADLPQALCKVTTAHGGFGGTDLSLGGEAVPVQWVNEVDRQVPPAVVYVRSCIDVDVRPDWVVRPARCCSTNQAAHFLHDAGCTGKVTFPGKPDDFAVVECSWACTQQGSCDSQCCRRSLQRGTPYRLQVFKHVAKGWCAMLRAALSRAPRRAA